MCKSLPLFPEFVEWITVDCIAVSPEVIDWETDCTPPGVNGLAAGCGLAAPTPADPGPGACIPVGADFDAFSVYSYGVSFFDVSDAFHVDLACLGPLDAPAYIPRGSSRSYVCSDGQVQRDWVSLFR